MNAERYIVFVEHASFHGAVGPFDSRDDAWGWSRNHVRFADADISVAPLHSGQGIFL